MEKSKRQALIERRRAEKRRGQMRWLAITIIAAVALTALLIFSGQVRTPSVEHSYTEKNGTQLGSPEAPVLVVEYGDFQCSHCRNFYVSTESLLIDNHVESGEVLFEYRVVDFLGIDSARVAEASFCAADQNLFWEYHDVVFENFSAPGSGGYSQNRLLEFAETLDMDQSAFAACLQSGEKAAQVKANQEAAVADGVRSTPSFVVNGTVLVGNQPYSNLQEVIAAALGSN